MRLILSHVVLCTAAIAGCASIPAVSDQQDPVLVMMSNGGDLRYTKDVRVITNSVAGTPASLWPALNAAYIKLGLPVTARDASRYALAAQNAEFNGHIGSVSMSRIVDCGMSPSGSRANGYRVWLSVATQLQPSSAGTTVRTTVMAKAQDPGSSSTAVQCGTTGELEGAIAKELGTQ